MGHETALIETIAIGLTAAFIGGMIARRLRLSPIVGYLLAGVVVGPFTPGLVADTTTASQLAELGVILLMFGVGIHISIADLLAVGRTAVPGAIGHSIVATVLGIGLGMALGWGLAGGLVLGLSLSVASTVVLLRALEDRSELDSQHGRIALGWLIVEDLFTVVVLVLLPTIAPLLLGQGDGSLERPLLDLVVALGKTVIFAAVMLVVGTRFVPVVLAAVARERSRELFTLAVLAIAFGIAFAAWAVFGVSFALGAFLAGVVLAESDMSHQAAADALPLSDAFAVLFFVSVGMLVDPAYLLEHPGAVVAVTLVIVVGKSIAAVGIAAVFRYPVRTGLTVGAALAQIGEFSFILATLGLSLGLLPADAYQLIVAGSVVSITLNPFVFRLVEPVGSWIRARSSLVALLEGRSGRLAVLPARHAASLHGHAVLCGYGRVGRMIAAALARRGFRYVIVSDDRREVERLRRDDVPALYGDAARLELLQAARIAAAKVVIVAIPEPQTARLVVDRTREHAPRVPVVVRTHSASEAVSFRAMGPSVQAVHAEREVAIQMTRYSLRRFGISSAEVDAIAEGLRRHGGGEAGPGATGGSGTTLDLDLRGRLPGTRRRRSEVVPSAPPGATGSEATASSGPDGHALSAKRAPTLDA